MLDPTEKRYTTSAVVAASGVKPVTFHAWRARHGLFATEDGDSSWRRFSKIDICLVRLIYILTIHGIDAKDAISIVMGGDLVKTQLSFVCIFHGEAVEPIFGFLKGDATTSGGDAFDMDTGKPAKKGAARAPAVFTIVRADLGVSLGDLMSDTNGVVTLIDLRKIVLDVQESLNALDEPVIATKEETHRIVFEAAAKAFALPPEIEGSEDE